MAIKKILNRSLGRDAALSFSLFLTRSLQAYFAGFFERKIIAGMAFTG